MNCKPGDMAWICLPSTEGVNGRIHGMVVKVGAAASPGKWWIQPPVELVLDRPTVDGDGESFAAGAAVVVDEMEDEWLRPIRGDREVTHKETELEEIL